MDRCGHIASYVLSFNFGVLLNKALVCGWVGLGTIVCVHVYADIYTCVCLYY